MPYLSSDVYITSHSQSDLNKRDVACGEYIKKNPHPPVYEECRRIYDESILVNSYLAIIYPFLDAFNF